jgi:hypothetical protein
MLSGIGSSKVLSAKGRITKENKFLGSLSVQCDDGSLIDQVIGDDGEVLHPRTVMAVIEQHPDQVRFFKDGAAVALHIVKKSFDVIAQCQATVNKFTKK